MNFELRDYQKEAVKNGINILLNNKILILNYEVRTGKTHIALEIAKNYKSVLFVTKKKAIPGIKTDYETAGHNFEVTFINYESLHKVEGMFDLVICDESHTLGAYPKVNVRTKILKKLVRNDLILMTGTLMPESNSQIYHQLQISPFTPFKLWSNFYKWFTEFGIRKKKYVAYGEITDYSDAIYTKIYPYIQNILLSYTQKEAGFKSEIKEKILQVPLKKQTYLLIEKFQKDKVLTGVNEVILGDTAVKVMQKVHQMFSGTIKFESGNRSVFDLSKINFIDEYFKGKKIAIFYKFIAELDAIKTKMDITQDIEEFNTTDKNIALQIVSGREGINLSKADALVFYNIDFSALSYWQARDRMNLQTREENLVYWIFSKNGIEFKIYNAVMNKRNYTLQTFRKDYKSNLKKS